MIADYTDGINAEKSLRAANNKLHELAPQVAIARQVKEFSSDRRKALLARYAIQNLTGGDGKSAGVTMAETMARANINYCEELGQLERQFRDAEAVIAKWQATQATFEAARSLISLNKEIVRNMGNE